MKRTISIAVSVFLLLVLCTSSIFYYACLDIAQAIAQAEADMAIAKKEESKFRNIMVSVNEFRQSDGEIWHNNHLYDVIGYKIVKDSVLVTVYHDEKEECIAILIGDSFGNSTDDSFTPYSGDHLVSKHKNITNDTKWVCDRITIPLTGKYIPARFGHINAINYASAIAVETSGPPPKNQAFL